MSIPFVFDVQRYCIHDGEGIRTTVFFKGCPLSCLWCHNPESRGYFPQMLFSADRCSGCASCMENCPQQAISVEPQTAAATNPQKCVLCGRCIKLCPASARAIAGRQYSVEELTALVSRDEQFYEQSGGGVTFSGGEAAAQDMDYMEPLAKAIHRRGISLNIDTCGAVPGENLLRLVPYTDCFLYDIKAMDSELHRRLTGRDNKQIVDNLLMLLKHGTRINVRIPVIGGANDSDEEMCSIARFVSENVHGATVNLLPYHNTGTDKYCRLGEAAEGHIFTTPSAERMGQLSELFASEGISNVHIGG